VVDDYYNFGEL